MLLFYIAFQCLVFLASSYLSNGQVEVSNLQNEYRKILMMKKTSDFCYMQMSEDLVISLNEPRAKIQGHILNSFRGQKYYAYQEIPYAVPPVGELRFAEPEFHPGWTGILNATKNKKICMQPGGSGTEDCLVLNVYTPVTDSSVKLPVLFWIHGGAFLIGTGQYQRFNSHRFMDFDVVVVTINYRLGPLGFLTTEDGVIPGNLGLKDQLLALKWVNKNIELFGGDPQKVTISGQSAGSVSATFHILSQKATGLFRAAILESGSALCHTSFITTARNYSFQLGRQLDGRFTSNDSRDLLNLLKKAPAQAIQSASEKIRSVGNNVGMLDDLFWAIVSENPNYKNAYITEPMHESLKNGNFSKVPIIVGYTSEELIPFIHNLPDLKKLAFEHDQSPATLLPFKLNICRQNLTIAGEKLKNLYTGSTFSKDLASFVRFSSDIVFVNPTIRYADLASKLVPVYLYQFSYQGSSRQRLVNIPNLSGAGHSEELNYIFNGDFQSEMDLVTSERVLTMWTNFIKELNPTPEINSSLGLVGWPSLKSNNLQYLDIDTEITVRKNPKRYIGIRDIFEEYTQPPYNIY